MKIIAKKVLSFFPTVKKGRVGFIVNGFSGSNSYALYKFSKLSRKEVEIEKIDYFQKLEKKRNVLKILKSQIVISTHGFVAKSRGSIYIELWHGFPLKTLGLLHKNISSEMKRKFHEEFNMIDIITSYSAFYTTLLNACVGVDESKYIITGMPRNDLLIKSNGKENLKSLLDIKVEDSKIIFYLPTFRKGFFNLIEGSFLRNGIFGIDEDLNELNRFLEQNDILLIFKPHPMEEKFFEKFPKTDRIIFIRNSDLEKHQIDLYEILNAADLLITDYSSVYFDFLLLNRPIIFIPRDLDVYRETRGLLLEPYDLWTPGPKVLDQKALFDEILKSLSDPDYYADERERLKNIVHYYQDANSSKRVWEIVKYHLEK